MKQENIKLMREQLDRKLKPLINMGDIKTPIGGWIKAIRTSLGITLKQLSKKLDVSPQSINQLEKREKSGTITINKLKRIASLLNMNFVYAFVPKEGSLEKMIEKRATEIATKIVMQTSHNMKLEDQENSYERIKAAIKNRSEKIKNEMPGYLWD